MNRYDFIAKPSREALRIAAEKALEEKLLANKATKKMIVQAAKNIIGHEKHKTKSSEPKSRLMLDISQTFPPPGPVFLYGKWRYKRAELIQLLLDEGYKYTKEITASTKYIIVSDGLLAPDEFFDTDAFVLEYEEFFKELL